MTVTPGTSGRVSINARGRDGSQSLAPRELYSAETFTVSAGDVVGLEAINAAATYTDPAESGAALQALVSGGGNLAYVAVASTTGTPGEVRKLSDGPDKGAVLTWAIPDGASAYAWCWQIYPLAAYL